MCDFIREKILLFFTILLSLLVGVAIALTVAFLPATFYVTVPFLAANAIAYLIFAIFIKIKYRLNCYCGTPDCGFCRYIKRVIVSAIIFLVAAALLLYFAFTAGAFVIILFSGIVAFLFTFLAVSVAVLFHLYLTNSCSCK